MASVLRAEVVKLLQKLNLPPFCDTANPSDELVRCKEVFGAPLCASSCLPLAGLCVLVTDRHPVPRDLGILGLKTEKNNRELIIETLPDYLNFLNTRDISIDMPYLLTPS